MGGLYAQAHRQRRRSDLFWPWGLIRHCQVKRKNFRTNYHKYSRKPKWIPTSHFPQRSLKKETQHYPEHDSKNGVWPQIDLMLQLISKRWNLIKRYLASYRCKLCWHFQMVRWCLAFENWAQQKPTTSTQKWLMSRKNTRFFHKISRNKVICL